MNQDQLLPGGPLNLVEPQKVRPSDWLRLEAESFDVRETILSTISALSTASPQAKAINLSAPPGWFRSRAVDCLRVCGAK